jgi:hypothetical protein
MSASPKYLSYLLLLPKFLLKEWINSGKRIEEKMMKGEL